MALTASEPTPTLEDVCAGRSCAGDGTDRKDRDHLAADQHRHEKVGVSRMLATNDLLVRLAFANIRSLYGPRSASLACSSSNRWTVVSELIGHHP